jgi:hypothetical protein
MLLTLAIAALPLDAANAPDAKAAFERLKTLAGHWEGESKMGKAVVTYELVAGGTTLVERETFGRMPVMMTMYHLDGGRLVLTHYCMVGNQPRMRLTSFDAATGTMRFEFLDATGMADKNSGHMRNATVRVEPKRLSADWEFFEGGQLKNTESVAYKRAE